MLKKIAATFLCLAVLLSLNACGSETPKEDACSSFSIEEYKIIVNENRERIYNACVYLSNLGEYEHNYWKSYNALGPESGMPDTSIDAAFEWLAENSDGTKESVEAAFRDIRQQHKEIVLNVIVGPEAREIYKAYTAMYDAYIALYNLVTEPSNSIDDFVETYNACVNSIKESNQSLSLFLDGSSTTSNADDANYHNQISNTTLPTGTAVIYFLILLLIVILFIFSAKLVRLNKQEQEVKESKKSFKDDPTYTHNYNTTPPNTYSTAPVSRSYTPTATDPLNTFVRYSVFAPSLVDNLPMVYKYPNISVSDVNRECLREMVQQKDFEASLSKGEHGEVFLKRNGNIIAKLEDKVEMCIDWITKGLPVFCQFVAFQAGKEKVALFFYKDQESALSNNKHDIVKLTACMSSEKQETIAFLENGQNLFIDIDDNDKPYVRDIDYQPIGNLPAKYARLYEEDAICGIFFDHSETKEDDKEIPFVRIYLEQ